MAIASIRLCHDRIGRLIRAVYVDRVEQAVRVARERERRVTRVPCGGGYRINRKPLGAN